MKMKMFGQPQKLGLNLKYVYGQTAKITPVAGEKRPIFQLGNFIKYNMYKIQK